MMATDEVFHDFMNKPPLERAAGYYAWAYDHHLSDPELASEFERVADGLIFLSNT